MSHIVVTGSAGGLGSLICEKLREAGHDVFGWDLKEGLDATRTRTAILTLNELTDARIDVLINCAGYNKLQWFEDVEWGSWNESMSANAYSILSATQALLPDLIASKGTILNIISDAAWRPMTCSLAYNASKAAAEMMTKQMARELTRKYGITVFGIAPNKLRNTSMSDKVDEQVCKLRGWTPEEAEKYQLESLTLKEETDPAQVAGLVEYLLSSKEAHRYLTGCILPYGS